MEEKASLSSLSPAPVPEEYEKDKLIVQDILDDVDEDMFTMFVEQRLGMDGGGKKSQLTTETHALYFPLMSNTLIMVI